MKTKDRIVYDAVPQRQVAIIPKGTQVIPADNLPYNAFWAEPWDNMTEVEKSWQRNYGFLITPAEVEQD